MYRIQRTRILQGVIQTFFFFFTHAIQALAIDDRLGENAGFVTTVNTGKTETVVLAVEHRKGKTQIVANIVKGILFDKADFAETVVLHGHDIFLGLVDEFQ